MTASKWWGNGEPEEDEPVYMLSSWDIGLILKAPAHAFRGLRGGSRNKRDVER